MKYFLQMTIYMYEFLLNEYLFIHKGQNSDKRSLSFHVKIKTNYTSLSTFKCFNRKDMCLAYLTAAIERRQHNGNE